MKHGMCFESLNKHPCTMLGLITRRYDPIMMFLSVSVG